MNILKKRNILKLAATFMLVAMMAGAFAGHTKSAFAAACAPGNLINGDIPADAGVDNCAMGITANFNNVTDLTFNSTTNVVFSILPLVTGINDFTFTAHVTDTRGALDGWQLQAASAGLSDGTTNLPVTIGALTPVAADCSGASLAACGTTLAASTVPLSVNGAAATFISATTTTPITGILTINGTGSVDASAVTPGAYTGTITLSLLNVHP